MHTIKARWTPSERKQRAAAFRRQRREQATDPSYVPPPTLPAAEVLRRASAGLRAWHEQCRIQRKPAQDAENHRRLIDTRRSWGHVTLRWMAQVRMAQGHPWPYGSLRGQAIRVTVDEVVDAYDLLRDLMRFIRAWRPMRQRTEAAKGQAAQNQEQWDRLAGDVQW